jgi:hypothetical protein
MESRSLGRLLDRRAAALLSQTRDWAAALGCIAFILAGGMPDPAWGQYRSSGYSRPSIGSGSFSSRRPSIGGSGGYRRPSSSAPVFSGSSPGDRAMSRGLSSEALRNYRASQQPPPSYAPPRTYAPPPASSGGGWMPGGGWGAAMPRRAPSWGGGWGTVSPRRSFGTGVVTGVALWAALNALTSSPSRAEYFYTHRNDPAYREWRQDAESTAARDPEVASKLAELDRRMAQIEATPGSTGGGPAVAREPEGGFSIWGIVLVIGGIVVLFWLWRRRAAHPRISAASTPPDLGGSAESRFRVGMVIPVDPAPFLLAAGLTKIQPPDASGRTSIEAIGLLRYGNVVLHRLYLPGGRAFFQLHLGADGRPDECRYFSQIDEVTPADQQEWGFWLDQREGLIGWPTFQTKDGKLYGRVWAPGQTRIAPRQIEETRRYVDRSESRRLQAMLYGASTEGAAAAAQTEYILVSAIEADGQAWVEVQAGIDINPAALQLPGVPLTP